MHQRFVDDMGRELVVGRAPQRIVSLVPSETETLFALGLGDRVVGRTEYCVSPVDEVADIAVVGGTKSVDPAKVLALSPDLILANQEENARGPLSKLADERLPVFVSFPRTVAQAVAHVARVARMCRIEPSSPGADVVKSLYELIRAPREPAAGRRISVFVPIWRDPWMTFSADTFASDVLSVCGADNAFADRERRYPLSADLAAKSPLAADQDGLRDVRYPRIQLAEVVERAPDAILLPDEPYEFGDAEAAELSAAFAPGRAPAIERTCGRHLFWAGTALLDAIPALSAHIARIASALPPLGD